MSKVVCNNFPFFGVDGKPLQIVTEFKYLGYVITCTLSDDKDVHCEMRNMYIRTNTLMRRFGKCFKKVKVRLFRSYSLCMYGTALWNNLYTLNCMKNKKAVLPQGNRAMPQVFFSVEVCQQHSLQV